MAQTESSTCTPGSEPPPRTLQFRLRDETISLRPADKSGTGAKRQSPGDNGRLPDHVECHILSVVSGILVGVGGGADGQDGCSFSMVGWDSYP